MFWINSKFQMSYQLPNDQSQNAATNKNELLQKLQMAQKQNYDRKKNQMFGQNTGVKRSTALQSNGQLTLEQMKLDRGDNDLDQYDQFIYQQRQGGPNPGDPNYNIKLDRAANYMGVQNTIGYQMHEADSLNQRSQQQLNADNQQSQQQLGGVQAVLDDDLEEMELTE